MDLFVYMMFADGIVSSDCQYVISFLCHFKGGGVPCYMLWLFYGFAICYNNKFNTAIIHFQLLLYKNVMVLYAIKKNRVFHKMLKIQLRFNQRYDAN